jgi:hypothetical protein
MNSGILGFWNSGIERQIPELNQTQIEKLSFCTLPSACLFSAALRLKARRRAGRAKKTLHVFDTLQVLALLFSTPARKASLEPLSRRGRNAEKRVGKLQGSNWFWFKTANSEIFDLQEFQNPRIPESQNPRIPESRNSRM